MGVAAAGAGLSAIGGLAKTIKGARQERQARQALENYQRQDLTNVYDDVQVSTLGADLQREELARASATSLQALQAGGIREVLGGVGRIQESNVRQSRQIAADLDRQQQQINFARAQDQSRIRQLQEQREREDLAGLGQQLAVGQQNVFSGIGDIAQSVGSLGRIGIGGATGAVGQGNPLQTTAPTPATPYAQTEFSTGAPIFTGQF